VHDFGDVSIASSVGCSAASRRDTAQDIFTADRWKRAGDSWKLASVMPARRGRGSRRPRCTAREAPIVKRY
jgi:hypothetical protein